MPGPSGTRDPDRDRRQENFAAQHRLVLIQGPSKALGVFPWKPWKALRKPQDEDQI